MPATLKIAGTARSYSGYIFVVSNYSLVSG